MPRCCASAPWRPAGPRARPGSRSPPCRRCRPGTAAPPRHRSAETALLRRLHRTAEALAAASPDTGWLVEHAQRLAEQHAEQPVVVASWHGDWVPWNMTRDGDQVLLWDWEHYEDDVLAGFDHLHYLAQTRRMRDGTDPAAEDAWLDEARAALTTDWGLDEGRDRDRHRGVPAARQRAVRRRPDRRDRADPRPRRLVARPARPPRRSVPMSTPMSTRSGTSDRCGSCTRARSPGAAW